MIIILLLLMTKIDVAQPFIFEDHVDVIELNHFHNPENGKLVFSQFLFYGWSDQLKIHVIKSWYIRKDDSLPERDLQTGEYLLTLKIDMKVLKIRSNSFRETKTNYDIERMQHDIVSEDNRIPVNGLERLEP